MSDLKNHPPTRSNDPDEPEILRTQKAHQVTIEQGSKNAAGKRAEVGEAPAKKINARVISADEQPLGVARGEGVQEGQSLPPKRADGVFETQAVQESRLASAEEAVAQAHREQVAESATSSDHLEKVDATPGAVDHRELAVEAPGTDTNRVKLDSTQVQDADLVGVPKVGLAASNFQAAPEVLQTSDRVLVPEVEGMKARDWDLPASDSSPDSSKEDPVDADIEEEIDVGEVLADLNALAQGVEEPPAEFYEQMDFPARVVHLHIENEKVQAQIKELEKPWERV